METGCPALAAYLFLRLGWKTSKRIIPCHGFVRGEGQQAMKVRASVKKICVKCKVITRNGVVRVICENPKHKQRQG